MKTKKTCPYCSGNPTPHYINWYFDTINILFERLQIGIFLNPLARFLARFENDISLFLIGFFRLLGIVSLGTTPQKTTLGRAKALWDEADKRGFEMREVRLLDKNTDTYIIRRHIPGKRSKEISIFSGIPRPKGANTMRLSMIDDKSHFKKLCRENGFPVPEGGCARSLSEAYTLFDRLQKPLIVKPRMGSRGRHSLTYINTREDLKKAYKIAKQLCLWVIIEEQMFGAVYRGTVINYKLEGVFAASQPKIVGDGVRTIHALTEEKNATRPEGILLAEVDAKMTGYLVRQLTFTGYIKPSDGYESWPDFISKEGKPDVWNIVPRAGDIITLSEKIGMDYGGDSGDETDLCHPDTCQLFEDLGRVFDDTILGFDLMIPDISRSWKEQRCGLFEANTMPFFHLHHDPHYGTPRNVAAKIWDMVGWK